MVTVQHWNPQRGPLPLASVREVLQGEGMVTAWWSDLPGTRPPEHAHPFPETRWIHASEVVGLTPVVYVTGTTDRSQAPALVLPK